MDRMLNHLSSSINSSFRHSFHFNPKTPLTVSNPSFNTSLDSLSSATSISASSLKKHKKKGSDSCANAHCSCRRRRFLFGAAGASLLPDFQSYASDLQSDPMVTLNRYHPQRPDWYEQFYALCLENVMKSYEAEAAAYKTDLFSILRGKSTEVLELGIGTGPNLKYYADGSGLRVTGIDPNKTMEKYAREAAVAAGLPLFRFNFTQAVAEALPVADASMDVVIGTLVLCSVADVKMTLQEVKRVLKPGGHYIFIEHVAAKEGTMLRSIQNVFDPLEQTLFDGCHLTRETGVYIAQAGFSTVNINTAFLSAISLIGPHVYGIACKWEAVHSNNEDRCQKKIERKLGVSTSNC